MKTGIVFDTETTDLLAPELADLIHQPFITEICLCKFDLKTFRIVEEFDTMVNIPIPVPDHITKLTGITDFMLEGKPTFSEIVDSIVEICDGSEVVVGHNLMFDLEVLRHNMRRVDAEDRFPKFSRLECTIEKSKHIKRKRLKLGVLYKMATGQSHEGAHRAKADVLATLECYKFLVNEGCI